MTSLVDLTLKLLLKGQWTNKKDIERFWDKHGKEYNRGRYQQSSVGQRLNDVREALNNSYLGNILELQERVGEEKGGNPNKIQYLKEWRIVPKKNIELKCLKQNNEWNIYCQTVGNE